MLVFDLRNVLRSMVRHGRSTAVVVATLAIGIGANIVIFSFAKAILLTPLPYPDADRLVRIETVRGGELGPVSLRELRDVEDRLSLFEGIAAHGYGNGGYNLSGGGTPEEIPALLATHNLFEVLGVELALGTTWPEEGDRLRNHSVVLGHGLWQRRWGGDPAALDGTLTLDGADLYRVYGVAPEGLDYPGGKHIYRSIAFRDLDVEDRSSRFYRGLGRLRSDVTPRQAQQALAAVAADLAMSYPDTNRGVEYALTPLTELYVGPARPYLVLLLVAVGLVLLLAVANVASISAARALAGARETTVRRALGAGRWGIVRPWLLEGLMCGLLGCLAAVGLATAGVPILRALIGVDLPHWMQIDVDHVVLAYALGLALASGLATVAIPAWQASRRSLTDGLGLNTRAPIGGTHAQGGLLVAQVAIAVLLVIGAGLTVGGFRALSNTDVGFDSEDRLTFRVNLGWRAYDVADKTRNYFRQLIEGLEALPGVVSVATNSNLPFGGVFDRRQITLEGQDAVDQQDNPFVNRGVVSPGYFEMMNIALLRGRVPGTKDVPDGPAVAVVNQRAAEALWPGRDPVGQRLKFGDPESERPWLEVVGVVANVAQERIGETPGLDVYVDLFQRPDHNAFVVVRGGGPPEALARAANAVALDIDPDQSTWQPVALSRRVGDSIWKERMAGTLVSLFSILAVVVAAVGLYGLLARIVQGSRREIGVRMALGGSLRQVLGGVLMGTFVRVGIGIAIGIGAALLVERGLQRLFDGQLILDPMTFVVAPAALLLVAVLASWGPIRQAAGVEPMTVLREE